uniref:Dynamin N-terminal domain-containing protein n=1 Tax=Desulfatirhabdium butyrativorans TaxID=340467 RepID=A0A7C4RMP9_9BACT
MIDRQLLGEDIQRRRASVRQLLQRCMKLAEVLSDNDSLQLLVQRLSLLETAAMFVVVGEVKSGKSSFINALFRESICEVAADPCTANIQELVYGNEYRKTVLGNHWERVHLPQEVLREITIVDTPGTNSILREHQAITERYLPQSDVVIFVFPARNPYTHTAWELLSLVRSEWHRKTVFVLQQADLVTQSELALHRERVVQYARQRHVQEPIIFAVSAKREMEGAADSGFAEFREFLRKTVESGEVWRIKWQGTLGVVRHVTESIRKRMEGERQALLSDRDFFSALLSRVSSRRQKGEAFREMVVDRLSSVYDRLSRRLENDIVEALEVGNLLRRSLPFSRDHGFRTWMSEVQKRFEEDLRREIEAESLRVAQEIVEGMRAMFQDMMEAIARRQQSDITLFEPLHSDRMGVLDRLRDQLERLNTADAVYAHVSAGSNIGKLTLAGGGLAVMGAVVLVSTHMIAFDVTGGVLASLGTLMMVLTMGWKRGAILREIVRRLEQARAEFRERLDGEIAQMLDKVFLEVEHRLKEPLHQVETRLQRLSSWIEEAAAIEKEAEEA